MDAIHDMREEEAIITQNKGKGQACTWLAPLPSPALKPASQPAYLTSLRQPNEACVRQPKPEAACLSCLLVSRDHCKPLIINVNRQNVPETSDGTRTG